MFIYKTRNIQNLNEFNTLAVASNSKIIIVIKFGEDSLRFTLSEELTVEEDTALELLVSGFEDTIQINIPKIYTYAKEEAVHKHFHNIDYKKELNTSLIPKRTIVKGEVTEVKWYASLNDQMEPTNLILKVDIDYTRNASGFATSRIVRRTWINEDGSENVEAKITPKYYFINPSDMIDEGLKRRKLLVNNLQLPTLTFMSEALMPKGYTQESVILQAREFMDDYESEFSKFIENSSTITTPSDDNFGKKTVIVALEDSDPDGRNKDYNIWMDAAPPSLGGLVTIRQYIIGEFDI